MKNKLALTAFISTLSLSTIAPVLAQGFTGNPAVNVANQGFSGPHQGINTIRQVLAAGFFSDDMPVTLIGYIKASLGGDMYLFTDATGEVTVEIDHDKWFGQSVSPKNKVQLSGEIDKNIGGVKVDVDSVRILE
ncbi:YgiW/YdeI family stress tolerance OB fold protein [Vibrio hepatarius]|uniref:YgiW/YdeI family stress tolerance OB fold protein n=1 Tax=Vibrio hepatarius TaxID=171383 RepID=UPI001C08FD0D|nr:NirD/YgiW/YdeI family stress tolerance protein [Vibrio hepatarius]MBU2898206.1 NirD/YgiW/YdeI family stress tolerance protein [Vibrio hepatarius]